MFANLINYTSSDLEQPPLPQNWSQSSAQEPLREDTKHFDDSFFQHFSAEDPPSQPVDMTAYLHIDQDSNTKTHAYDMFAQAPSYLNSGKPFQFAEAILPNGVNLVGNYGHSQNNISTFSVPYGASALPDNVLENQNGIIYKVRIELFPGSTNITDQTNSTTGGEFVIKPTIPSPDNFLTPTHPSTSQYLSQTETAAPSTYLASRLQAMEDLKNSLSTNLYNPPKQFLDTSNLISESVNGFLSLSGLETTNMSLNLQTGRQAAVSPIPVSTAFLPANGLALGMNGPVPEILLQAMESPKGLIVQLDPPEMGRVHLEFAFESNRTVALTLSTENDAAQNFMKNQREAILSILREQGISNIDIKFANPNTDSGHGDNDPSQSAAHDDWMSDGELLYCITCSSKIKGGAPIWQSGKSYSYSNLNLLL